MAKMSDKGSCSRLRGRYEASGSRTALTQALAKGCDWAEEIQRPVAPCREVPRAFTTKTGRRVEFTARVGDCGPRKGPSERQLAARARFSALLRGEGVAPGDCGPDVPAGCEKDRRATKIITPQAEDRAEYRVIEAEDLIPSHNPLTFDPDPRYPSGVQEREYQFDQNEQLKVASGAGQLNPGIMLHRSPTAVDGPPLVTEDGCALGGNGRSMMLKRAYAQEPARAKAYMDALKCEAGTFGISQRELAGMKEPVLVRVVKSTRCEDDPGELAKAVRRYNEGLTNVIDARALGVSQARSLSASSLSIFGSAVSGERSLREAMQEDPGVFVAALENDRIITKQNRTKFVKASGELTNEGKDAIEAMFVGRALGNADRIRMTPAAVLQRVEKAVPYLTAVAGRNPDFDVTTSLQKAIDLVNAAKASGNSIEAELAQMPMFAERPTAEVVGLARVFANERPMAVRDRFKEWASVSAFDPSQGGLLGKPPSREEAFIKLVGNVTRKGRALFQGSVVQQPQGLARIVVKGDGKPLSEGGTGYALGEGVIEYMTGPQRGARVPARLEELGEVVGG